MSRRYTRNGGNRRSTNGQPGQWTPLRAYIQSPGVAAGETTFVCFADQHGAVVVVATGNGDLPSLTCHDGSNYTTVDASTVEYQGEDAEGSLFAIRFPVELNPLWPWFIRVPAGWRCVRARDGSPLAGLVMPSGGVTETPAGWIGLSNIADTPPPAGNPPLWIPTNWSFPNINQLQFETFGTGALMSGPLASALTANGVPADTVSSLGGGLYQAEWPAPLWNPGEVLDLAIPQYSSGWDLANGAQLGEVRTLFLLPA